MFDPTYKGEMAKIGLKIHKIEIWPKLCPKVINSPNKSQGTIFGECLNYKSGLRILIWPLKVPFFWSQRLALLAKVTVFRPKKWHFEWPNQNSKTTFIVQTFPKYGPYGFDLVKPFTNTQ